MKLWRVLESKTLDFGYFDYKIHPKGTVRNDTTGVSTGRNDKIQKKFGYILSGTDIPSVCSACFKISFADFTISSLYCETLPF